MFGKKQTRALELLTGTPWLCAACGTSHVGLFALACFAPDAWTGAEDYVPNHALRLDGDFLSEDFCVLRGEHFFVRASFEIPIHGMGEKFSFGVWATLSRDNFDIYLDAFDDGIYSDMGPWFGWFSNDLKVFGSTINLKARVHPQLERQRPAVSLIDADHPMAIAQGDGISPERALELYAFYGHRPA